MNAISFRQKQGQFYCVAKGKRKIGLEDQVNLLTSYEAVRNLVNATALLRPFEYVDTYLNYGLAEDFSFVQITLAILEK